MLSMYCDQRDRNVTILTHLTGHSSSHWQYVYCSDFNSYCHSLGHHFCTKSSHREDFWAQNVCRVIMTISGARQKFGQKMGKTKVAQIDWNGEKIDWKCFLKLLTNNFVNNKKVARNCLKWLENCLSKFLTKILPLEFSLAVGSRGSHNRKRFALVAEGNHCH